MSRCIHRRTTELAFHFAFHCHCLYLPADHITTSSTPPGTTRVLSGCSWLLLVDLELFVVVGVWLCRATIISSPFLSFLFLRLLFAGTCRGFAPLSSSPLPSLVAALSSRVPRRLLFCRDSFCSDLFARRSPPEPTTGAHRPRKRPRRMPSRFPPADHSHLRRCICISTTRRALSSWRCRVLLRRQRV